jgi:prepilin-type N-terminal cleavage/methylation domain-containing protein
MTAYPFPMQPRRGFTLIELLLVLTVVAMLAGLSLAGWKVAMNQSKLGRTRTLVAALAAAIAAYPERTTAIPATRQVRLLWDFNDNGLLDGEPATDASFTATQRSEAAACGYRGLLAMTGMAMPNGMVGTGAVPIDAWKNPIRIAFAVEIYGASGLGLWSAGPDGQDGTADDLTSWAKP